MSKFNYTKSNTNRSTTWEIQHNLDSPVVVADFIINLGDNGEIQEKAYPAYVEIIDRNTLVATWTVERSGYARITGIPQTA